WGPHRARGRRAPPRRGDRAAPGRPERGHGDGGDRATIRGGALRCRRHGGASRDGLRAAAGGASEGGRVSGRRPVFVVGLDAATFDLVKPFADAGHMPTLARLMASGVRAPLRSTLPALTPPGWTSAATGRNPGKHNIFNFYKTTGAGNG